MTTNDHSIRVIEVKPNAFNSKVNQAELRMEVSRTYPEKRVSNSHQSALAPLSAFGLASPTYTQERVCWVDVPKSWGVADVEKSLQALPKARIYRVLSFEPILTDSDYSWMDSLSESDREDFIQKKKDSQAVVDQTTGEFVTRAGRQLYRRLFFSAEGRADEDLAKVSRVTAVTDTVEETVEDTIQGIEAEVPATVAVEDIDLEF